MDSKQGLTQRINQARAATANGSGTINGRSSSAMKNNMDLYRHKYKEFKEAVLSDILRRGVFTDRVIKDSFYREIERRTDLDLSQMEMIMFDTLSELGVKTSEKAPAPPPSRRAKRPKTAKQRSIIIENGKVIQERAAVVDFSAEPDMYIPDDKTSQISSLPSDGTLSSAASSSESGSGSDKEEDKKADSDASKTHSSSSSESGSSESDSESEESSPPKPPSKQIQRRTSSLPASESRRA
uniref:Uncharacterized protein n=1 Tax=Panagrolaimus sp. PS1159 TaxID=55785 RepID=A0AC35G750_9BILA